MNRNQRGTQKIMYDLESVIYFGPHRGKTIRKIMHDDSDYIEYLLELEEIELDDEALEYLEHIDEQYDIWEDLDFYLKEDYTD